MEGANVLVVGAGGIGCELLKTLVLSNCNNITVVDLDTIDKTNLNRQFLFRRSDIGLSKSLTAAKVLKSLRPNLYIKGLHQNIMSLGDSFFEGFTMVFNALDNLEARRYVNRVTNFLNIPLIDAGTKSKNGQVTVHLPQISACYDCEPKATPKEYPVCTIRLTPTKLEHCIAWGKFLFDALFGEEDPNNILSDIKIDLDLPISLIFFKLFKETLPESHDFTLVFPQNTSPFPLNESQIPNFAELVNAFVYSFNVLKNRERKKFNKDDKDSIQFISAVSNIRALIFGIDLTSMFKVQEIAGKIVPAIGSTNAIVAGLQVIQGEKVLNRGKNHGTIWTNPYSTNNKLIFTTEIMAPCPTVIHIQCFTCSQGKCNVSVDFSTFTLKRLVNEVIIKSLSFIEPNLNKNGISIYESGEGIEEEFIQIYQKNLEKTLRELNFSNDDEIMCDDCTENLEPVVSFISDSHTRKEIEQSENIGENKGKNNRDIIEIKENNKDCIKIRENLEGIEGKLRNSDEINLKRLRKDPEPASFKVYEIL